jgi:tRNA(fMet)-specific endonuclease VapC
MGLILDTSILIAAERQRKPVEGVLSDVLAIHGEMSVAISTISVIELTHGIYRAENAGRKERRHLFVEGALRRLVVIPVSLEIARIAGQIEGEQAALGNIIATEDLLIGATALSLGHEVATLNTRHFAAIPGLKVVRL